MIAEPEVARSGVGLRALQHGLALLPRGRARGARALGRRLTAPFVSTVPPWHLGIEMVIDPTDPFQMEIWSGAYQPHVVSFLLHQVRPGSVVLCAGLHVGYVAAIARRLAGPSGRVVTAEPDPEALAWARRNLALAARPEDAAISILEGGLSNADGQVELHRSTVKGQSSFASPHHVAERVRVPVRQGDAWLAGLGVARLDTGVLDVEGWELHVLEGLSDTLARSPSVSLLVECSPWALQDAGATPQELVRFFITRGFAVRWAAHPDHRVPFGVWGPAVAPGSEGVANDLLCIGPGGGL